MVTGGMEVCEVTPSFLKKWSRNKLFTGTNFRDKLMNINAARLASIGVITGFAVMPVVTPGCHVIMNACALLLLSSAHLMI